MRRTALLVVVFVLGCSETPEAKSPADDPCGPGDDVEQAANTAESGAKTGASTAIAGVEQFGKSVGGFVEGGKEGAKEEWNAGGDNTKQTAKKGAGETRTAAKTKPCR
jgi:hypothetical protein